MTAGLGVPTIAHDVAVASWSDRSGGEGGGVLGAHAKSAAPARKVTRGDLTM